MRFDSSIKLFDRAQRLMPGGVSSPVRAISPYPFYTARADGPYLWDSDGNRFIDYCLAYGPMILGHRHPAIMQAVTGPDGSRLALWNALGAGGAAGREDIRPLPQHGAAPIREHRHRGHHGRHTRGARQYRPG